MCLQGLNLEKCVGVLKVSKVGLIFVKYNFTYVIFSQLKNFSKVHEQVL